MAFISQDDLYDRVKALAKIPNIKFTLKTCGNFDFRISVMIRDIKIVDYNPRGNRHNAWRDKHGNIHKKAV